MKDKILLETLTEILEEIAPPNLAESWDNCGFQVKLNNEVKTIMTALEVTEGVIKEARENSVDLIVSHHPLIFNNLNSISVDDHIGKMIVRLINGNISLYSTHTNFDIVSGGNNDYLGKLLGFKNVEKGLDSLSMARKANLDEKVIIEDIIDTISNGLNEDKSFFSLVGDPKKEVEKIGWCTGAGAPLLDELIDSGNYDLDLFITGDLKYHSALKYRQLGINVLDIGHYGSEKIFAPNMKELLEKRLSNEYNIKILSSKVDINPFVKL